MCWPGGLDNRPLHKSLQKYVWRPVIQTNLKICEWGWKPTFKWENQHIQGGLRVAEYVAVCVFKSLRVTVVRWCSSGTAAAPCSPSDNSSHRRCSHTFTVFSPVKALGKENAASRSVVFGGTCGTECFYCCSLRRLRLWLLRYVRNSNF